MKEMTNRISNRISKVFRPVDYIEELTPEEEERRELQEYYAENLERVRDFTENFDCRSDTITFTLYKTLYSTGEKTVIDHKDNRVFKMEQKYIFLDQYTVCSYIIEKLMIIMYAMLCYKTSGIHYTSVTPIFPAEFGINPENYTGISAEIVRNTDSETPEVLTVVYVPDVSKYDALICCGFTGTGHLCCPDIFLEDYKTNDTKNIVGDSLNISADIVLDDSRIRYIDINNVCRQLCNFLNCVNDSLAGYNKSSGQTDYFSEYDITPMDTLNELLKIMPAGKFINGRDDLFDICSVLDQNSNIVRLLKYLNEYENKDFNTDMNVIDCLITAANVSNYYGVDIQAMFDYYKIMICTKSYADFDNIHCNYIYNNNLIDYILPYITRSFGYKEFLDKNKEKIREQAENLADCIRAALRIGTVKLNCNFYVPYTVPYTSDKSGIGLVPLVRGKEMVRGKETFYKMWESDKQIWWFYMSAYGYKPELKI